MTVKHATAVVVGGSVAGWLLGLAGVYVALSVGVLDGST